MRGLAVKFHPVGRPPPPPQLRREPPRQHPNRDVIREPLNSLRLNPTSPRHAATITTPPDTKETVLGLKGGQHRTLSPQNHPILTGVSRVKGGQDQTLFAEAEAETPAERAAKTPAANARARKEPQNQRTKEHSPNPPEEGRSENSVTIEQTYTTGS